MISPFLHPSWGLPWWLNGRESTCQCRRRRFDLWVSYIPWRRKWQPSPVFLPRKSHGQRSLVCYSPWRPRVGHDLATKQQEQVVLICQQIVFWSDSTIHKLIREQLSSYFQRLSAAIPTTWMAWIDSIILRPGATFRNISQVKKLRHKILVIIFES